MAKAVTGFLAINGNFFVSEAEADMHDAELKITAYCVTHTPKLNPDTILEIVEALAEEIKDYLSAKDRLDAQAANESYAQEKIDHGKASFWTNNQEKINHDFDPDREWKHTRALDYSTEGSGAETDQADDDEGREGDDAILEQSLDGHEPVPDVGSSTQPESVQQQREGDGTGSGKRDARSVRGDKTLATKR